MFLYYDMRKKVKNPFTPSSALRRNAEAVAANKAQPEAVLDTGEWLRHCKEMQNCRAETRLLTLKIVI